MVKLLLLNKEKIDKAVLQVDERDTAWFLSFKFFFFESKKSVSYTHLTLPTTSRV